MKPFIKRCRKLFALIFVCVVGLSLAGAERTPGSRHTLQVTVTTRTATSEETESAIVRGQVIDVVGRELLVRISGMEDEVSFAVPHTAKVTKDRKPARLSAVCPDDYVTVTVVENDICRVVQATSVQ